MKHKAWGIADVPSLAGKVIIVTGGNSGLGFEAAKVFAQKEATIVLACRSEERGAVARDFILQESPNAQVEVMFLDLANLQSVEQFAQSFKKKFNQLHILLNNAGIMASPHGLTADGFESQMGTNHLGHFALTGHLLDIILSTPHSRVVSVSSIAHKWWGKNSLPPLFEAEKKYKPMRAYGRSKLANLLFSYELQRLFHLNNHSSIAVVAHPGASFTNLGRYFEGTIVLNLFRGLITWVLPKPHSASLSLIRAAADPIAEGGQYYGPTGFMQLGGKPKVVKSSKASYCPRTAQQIWVESEEVTGVSYGFTKKEHF